MSNWLTQHSQALRLVLSRLKSNLFSTLFISLAIAVSLALPVIMYLVLDSFSGLTGSIKNESHISVFLKQGQDDTTLNSIHNTLATNAGIKNFKFVSKAQALQALSSSNNNENILSGLVENPLPDAFFIEPAFLDQDSIDILKQQLNNLDGVEEVQIDNAWLKRLSYLLILGKKAMFVLAMLLGFALFAVIGNTVRMQILTQHEEIEVSQLIGATKSFIRRPFLYSGAVYGLFGGLLALLITFSVITVFNQSVSALAAEYQTNFSLNLPDSNLCIITCLTAIIIGLLSSYLAVSKSLSKTIN
ncbi:MAG: permease-like cell division protein FtsX [Methylophilaceae bacterium]